MKNRYPWGKINKTDARAMKKIATTGVVGGKSNKLKLPK